MTGKLHCWGRLRLKNSPAKTSECGGDECESEEEQQLLVARCWGEHICHAAGPVSGEASDKDVASSKGESLESLAQGGNTHHNNLKSDLNLTYPYPEIINLVIIFFLFIFSLDLQIQKSTLCWNFSQQPWSKKHGPLSLQRYMGHSYTSTILAAGFQARHPDWKDSNDNLRHKLAKSTMSALSIYSALMFTLLIWLEVDFFFLGFLVSLAWKGKLYQKKVLSNTETWRISQFQVFYLWNAVPLLTPK